MDNLPLGLQKFDEVLDTLPIPDKAIFLYRLCRMLCNAGKMKITDVVPTEEGEEVFFETKNGYKFHTVRSSLNRKIHLEIMKGLKPILVEAEMEIR